MQKIHVIFVVSLIAALGFLSLAMDALYIMRQIEIRSLTCDVDVKEQIAKTTLDCINDKKLEYKNEEIKDLYREIGDLKKELAAYQAKDDRLTAKSESFVRKTANYVEECTLAAKRIFCH